MYLYFYICLQVFSLTCLLILIFIPQHDKAHILNMDVLVYLFTTYSSLLVVVVVDIIAQACGHPVANTPVRIFLFPSDA